MYPGRVLSFVGSLGRLKPFPVTHLPTVVLARMRVRVRARERVRVRVQVWVHVQEQ